ncbi:MAG: hypothetical protein LR015_06340 [Verrucomicrobia bacterium]|nr:hypothetical protein [Verrucomicrobiota bacterium]
MRFFRPWPGIPVAGNIHFSASIRKGNYFCSGRPTPASISGDWYQTVFEFEANPSAIGPTEMIRNERVSVTHLGESSYLIETEGEDPETIELVQSGSLWTSSMTIESEEGFQRIGIWVRWVEDDLVFVNQLVTFHDIQNQLYHAEGRSSVLTRNPLPDYSAQNFAWSGNWNAIEMGMEAYSGTRSVDTFSDEFGIALHPMAGNTFQVRESGEGSQDTGETLVRSGDMLVINKNRTLNRVTFDADPQWRVRETSERFRIRALPVSDDIVFVSGQSGRLGLIEPKPGNLSQSISILSVFENFSLILRREGSLVETLSPLATSAVGKQLNQVATPLSPGLQWYYIPWFGPFAVLGGSYGYHPLYGTLFFGAEVDEDAQNVPLWIYIVQLGKWFVFAEEYGEGFAWDAAAGAVVHVSAQLD